MRTEQRTVYIADDGDEFADKAACMAHERSTQLAQHLSNREVLRSHHDCEEVAAFLQAHYVVIPRDTLYPLVSGLRIAITYLAEREEEHGPTHDNTFDNMLGPLGEIDEILST